MPVLHPPGRLTLPSQPLTDKRFVYTSADQTNVARTMARARERLLAEALQRDLRAIAAQAQLPGVVPKAPPAQRLRAGMGHAIALPTL